MTSALILAAGFGTRLRPLTLELPKPVVPVGDRPLLAHVAAACQRAGATHLIANAHHEHQKLANIIESLGVNIHVIVEPQIRGTAGGVAGARGAFEPGPVLIWNGDILTDAPARALLDLARARDAQVLAVAPRAAGEGTVGLGADGSVVRLRGRVFGVEVQGADYIGVMALGAGVVADLPEHGCLFGDVALPHLATGGKVWTVPSGAAWTDLGDLSTYVAANFAWLDAHLSRSESDAAAAASTSWLANDVSLDPRVSLDRCVLGLGAKVLGVGRVEHVIAWPGATFSAPLSRAVVLGSGRIVPFDRPAEN
jgi:mannose-1-phosphate guanylyltransferase